MLGSSRLSAKAMSTITHPLVVVLGATGAGKSKLALDIGKHMNGEIVSVDSMQIYEGLDIVTNKVTKEEQAICPHHMIGILSPRLEFTITDFQRMTLKTIQEIHDRGRLPILVGGTNYYVESILWDYLVNSVTDESENKLVATRLDAYRKELATMSTAKLHEKLKEVDPKSASLTHPNNRRKVVRALEVFHDTGKPISEYWDEQSKQGTTGTWGGPIKFPNACCLWVQCEEVVLKDRIYNRVNKMIEQGLINELQGFHETFNEERLKTGDDPDYEHGIFQSIGFKEFHNYLTAPKATPDDVKDKLFKSGVLSMKLHTWQYAKYQIKMIRTRILNRQNALPVYKLNATDPLNWDSEVLFPALNLLWFLYGDHYNIRKHLISFSFNKNNVMERMDTTPVSDRRLAHNFCVECDKHIPDCQWEGHLKSRKHKNRAYKRNKTLKDTSKILKRHINNVAKIKKEMINPDLEVLENTFLNSDVG